MPGWRWDVAEGPWGAGGAPGCQCGLQHGAGKPMPGAMQQPLHCALWLSPAVPQTGPLLLPPIPSILPHPTVSCSLAGHPALSLIIPSHFPASCPVP